MNADSPTSYPFKHGKLSTSKRFVLLRVTAILESLQLSGNGRRVFDIGCGNGSTAQALYELGYEVAGVDPSDSGIQIAQANYPHLRIEAGSAYDNLSAKYGKFPAVISLEVIEHLYYPRKLIKSALNLSN